jgi:micrococcal nuclease
MAIEARSMPHNSIQKNLSRVTLVMVSVVLASCVQPTQTSVVHNDAPLPDRSAATATVVNVTDGDTLTAKREEKTQVVHLKGVDCPELRQAYGRQARQLASEWAWNHEVEVKEEEPARDGGVSAVVTLPDGRNLNHEMVRSGLCWWERQYTKDDSLPLLEAEAHAAQRGLWVQRDPIPPWEWRRMKVKPRVVEHEE